MYKVESKNSHCYKKVTSHSPSQKKEKKHNCDTFDTKMPRETSNSEKKWYLKKGKEHSTGGYELFHTLGPFRGKKDKKTGERPELGFMDHFEPDTLKEKLDV